MFIVMDYSFKSLSFLSLNVRGMRDSVKRKALFLFCKRSEADIVMLQETHSTVLDVKFWRSQWGSTIHYSHGSNNSAGVAILLHKFKGEVLESVKSSEGRWVMIVIKQENVVFIICNVYGYNSNSSNKTLFAQVSNNAKLLIDKYADSYILLGGDFNECLDSSVDRFPPRVSRGPIANNLILSLCSDLSLVDSWRFFNPDLLDFTWSNKNLSLKSRIDLFLISQSAIHFVKNISHSVAPFSDHKMISINLGDQQDAKSLRGYWKMNNTLLKDEGFNNSIKDLIDEIFSDLTENCKQKWEFFKYKTRYIAIKRSKVLKANQNQLENELLERLNELSKENITEEDKIEIKKLSLQLDEFYLNLAKGAFIRSRAKWLEEGEKNSSYFFSLEKRNGQRKALTSLNIHGTKSNDPTSISKFVAAFYTDLYSSRFNLSNCNVFIDKIRQFIPKINNTYKTICDSDITISEIMKALHSMKKGKSPGIDGLSVEFYVHFWEYIQVPLLSMYKECIEQKEMIATMKQGVISLIPKPGKDVQFIDALFPY